MKGKTRNKLIAILMTISMVLMVIPFGKMNVEAAEATSGYTTDENGKMEWGERSRGIDFRGYVNGSWQKVTYDYLGFAARIYKGNSSITITPKVTFVADGQAIMVTYVVKNTGDSTASDFRFWLGADTMVAENDASTNSVDSDNVVTMTNEKNNISFFAFSTTPGGTAVPAEWRSNANVTLKQLLENSSVDPATIEYKEKVGDSALVIYFPKESLLPGEVTEFTIVVGMGDSDTINDIIEGVKAALSIDPETNYLDEAVTDLTPGYKYAVISGDTKYTIVADDEGNLPLAGKDIYGKEYDLTGTKILIYQKGDGETIPSSVPSEIEIVARPDTPAAMEELTNTIEDIGKEDIETTATSIRVKAVDGQEYSIDGENWIQPGENGYVEFADLEEGQTYELCTRIKATVSAPASLPTDTVSVTTYNMFWDIEEQGYVGDYDGNTHTAKVVTSVEGATVTYSENPEDFNFNTEEISYKYSGEHLIYYSIEKEGYYNKFGTIEIIISSNELEKNDIAVETVEALIDDIYPIENTEECENKIKEARAEYDKLTDAQKDLVDNLVNLEWAEEEYPEIKAGIEHVHKFATEWINDDNYHWNIATCRHKDEIGNKAEHTWNEGEVTKQPTEEATGIKTYTCTVCKITKTEDIEKLPPKKPEENPKEENPEVVIPDVSVSYHTHIQTLGDSQGYKKDGEMAGTSGMAKRLENISIKLEGNPNLGIQYTTHCQTYGWLAWSCNNEPNGTSGEAKRLEAIKIQLKGTDKDKYDVYYRVHAQTYGWLAWAKNGEPSGTAGLAKRLEAIQVVVVKKGESVPDTYKGITSTNNKAFVVGNGASSDPKVDGAESTHVQYRTHVQTYGWQTWKYDGQYSGTTGEAKRLEAIKIELRNKDYEGSICYNTHVQTYGWQSDVNNPSTWKKDGQLSGTSGEAKRLEAIQIALTGEMAEHYDVYYRVHAQTYGWLGWAKNGELSGTAGYGKRLEGIQVVLVKKGDMAPDNNYMGISVNNESPFIQKQSK